MRIVLAFVTLVALATLAACGTLDHIPPAPRNQNAAALSVVAVFSICSEEAPFKDSSNVWDPHKFDPDVHWAPDRWSTGVAVSEAHVVTVGHGVDCAAIPKAMVTLSDGERFPSIVQRDDLQFGPGDDVARLRVVGAYDRFGLNVAPPLIRTAVYGERACAVHYHSPERCGPVLSTSPLVLDFPSYPGESGSPIYGDDGALLGIVTRAVGVDEHPTGPVTIAEPAKADWLEGT